MTASQAATPLEQHNQEIALNLDYWNRKPLLRKIYREYHDRIAAQLPPNVKGLTVELGSGIGNIKEVIPDCVRTDLFPNPWIDQIESAYKLSFADQTVRTLILFDVFHHLEFPGTALDEFRRVLVPGGRVILFEPYISLFGWLVYGGLHHEPVGWNAPIAWRAPQDWNPSKDRYYAAQGNTTRLFFRRNSKDDFIGKELQNWSIIRRDSFSALAYVLSGGYSKPQLYPDKALPLVQLIDRLGNVIPRVMATRALVVLEKK